jgi:hypothetical protein
VVSDSESTLASGKDPGLSWASIWIAVQELPQILIFTQKSKLALSLEE